MNPLPKMIYIRWDNPSNDEPYLLTSKDLYGLAEPGEKLKVGTYHLVEVNEVQMLVDVKLSK